MERHNAFTNILMNKISYEGKFYLILAIGLFGIFLLSLSYIKETVGKINNIDQQIKINDLQKPLRILLEHLEENEMLYNRSQNGDQSVVHEIGSMNTKISNDLRAVRFEEKAIKQTLANISPIFSSSNDFSVNDIIEIWSSLSSENNADSLRRSQLIEEVRNLIRILGTSSLFLENNNLEMFYRLEASFILIPEIQDFITRSTIIIEKMLDSKENTDPSLQRDLIIIMTLLDDRVLQLKEELGFIYQIEQAKKVNSYAFSLFNQFISKSEDFIKLIQSKILNSQPISLTLSDLISSSGSTLDSSFSYWGAATEEISNELQTNRDISINNLLWSLITSLVFIILAVLLALYVVRWITFVLADTEKNMNSFRDGNLSARANIFYRDQAGRMAMAFNSMASHYETLVQDLRKMVDVIKKLAAGDFSVRLETSPHSEIGHVAASFNQMAQTFGEIVGQLRELGISLATSATQITAASKQQELVITEQESTTREISVTANQISTTAQEFAETMNEVSQVADETAKLAGTGKKSLQHMEQIMGQMVQAAQSIASKLAVLNEKASNITSVITTITKVADQTNLLSLNASIEAEKAGEYGKSFAVIAKEIRRLADLTANATLDIEKIVTEIMTAVSTSVTGMDDFTHEIKEGTEEVGSVAEQLNTIMEQVQVLTSRFESINDGMQAQAIGAEQINDAIAQLNMSARETSSSLSGFRQTLQGLTIAAGDLKSAVDRIKKENLMENLATHTKDLDEK